MDIRRAMPVLTTTEPDGARAFCEGLLGFRVAVDHDGMMMCGLDEHLDHPADRALVVDHGGY